MSFTEVQTKVQTKPLRHGLHEFTETPRDKSALICVIYGKNSRCPSPVQTLVSFRVAGPLKVRVGVVVRLATNHEIRFDFAQSLSDLQRAWVKMRCLFDQLLQVIPGSILIRIESDVSFVFLSSLK